MNKMLSEELQNALAQIRDEFDEEDREIRERQIREWKKLEFYWAGITKIWWDAVANDWRVFQETESEQKQINVFRAFLESIIAALTTVVPPIKCMPDDADNISDVLTAKGGTKIAALIYSQIDAPLLFCKAVYIYCIQGMVAAYNYSVEDEKFGTVDVPKYKTEEVDTPIKLCPNCASEIETVHCDNCNEDVEPVMGSMKENVTRLDGVKKQPKARQRIDINGGLFVKVPNYARKQEDVPYLSYCYETHYSNVYKKYEHLRGKFKLDKNSSTNGEDIYEKWGRLSPQYFGEEPTNTPTVRNWWFRSNTFEVIEDESVRKELYRKFPKGVKCVWINDQYAEAINESLDDHWTLTYNPLSEYLHFQPLGGLLTSIQDISDELIDLSLQTIEHGIPQTFADPSVLNFNAYKQMETVPGAIYPAKAKSGKTLAEGFYTVSTATLSQEVEPFAASIEQKGQFISGALPSLFGGNQANSSRTAAQYSMSKNQAMQRLQITWKMINFFWKNTFSKVIPSYMETMLEDERLVKEKDNTFINVVIRKSELDGKIGNVTIESSENLPSTWGQIHDTVMQLIQLNNPAILESLGAPENLEILSNALGLNDFNLLGIHDREKQHEEIGLLTKSEPLPQINQMTGMPEEVTSIMPEFEVDNHKIEIEICRDWCVGEIGRQVKIENPAGYKNVLLHMKVHNEMLQAQMMPPPGMMQQPNQNGQKPQGPPSDNNKLRPLPQGNKQNVPH